MLFKPPFKWDELPKQYKTMHLWLTRNYHGILWDAGEIPYDKLNDVLHIILKGVGYIYVKGLEKKKWLSDIIKESKTIINLENLGCPSMKNNEITSCPYHEYRKSSIMSHCALENVKQLKCWIEKRAQMQSSSIGRSLELYYQLEERIEDMKPQDIAYLRKDFILKFAPTKIDRIWNELPEELQSDKEMIAHRRCRKNYNPIAIDYDEFDRMIPLIKDCSICKEDKT
ncbi:hypothetical protein PV328_004148 [Microctonus aethiopoides]|uniref:Uncharacterized protein n=1 Tax=Microctonus aethiopoides TaxID=144406 RepID=A0AA39FA40_9HYME|nr:hypothetical protein PV328_004148 [Microctonus aethiopoides]